MTNIQSTLSTVLVSSALAISAVAIGGSTNHAAASPTSGYLDTFERVNAYSTDYYNVRFFGDEKAWVYVDGDGDTDLDLYIYDENGNLICSDTDYTDRMYCEWIPVWTGRFRIEIRNLGDVYNEYLIEAG